MAGMGIDGLASGLDTTTLVNSLITLQAGQQSLLKTKVETTTSLVTALQALNTRVASLATAAETAAKATSWQAYTATSSSTSVTATASSAARPSSVSFHVDALATAQVSLTAEFVDVAGLLHNAFPPTISVLKADGTIASVSPAYGNLADVTEAINAAEDLGIKAVAVKVGSAYRLQITGTDTGADASFKVFLADEEAVQAAVAAGTEDALIRLDTVALQDAQDAQITLWKGVDGVEQTLNSASNTFAGLLTGVDLTVSAVTGDGEDPVTVTVATDTTAMAKLASDLFSNISVTLTEMSSRLQSTTGENDEGESILKAGLFSGDTSIRLLQQSLLDAVAGAYGGASTAEAGFGISRAGEVTFDSATFNALLASDPAKAQQILTGMATRLQAVAKTASDPIDGTLTLKVQSQQDAVTDLNKRITDWDERLEQRRESLMRTYTALETTIQNYQTQSTWLTQQIAALNAQWSSS